MVGQAFLSTSHARVLLSSRDPCMRWDIDPDPRAERPVQLVRQPAQVLRRAAQVTHLPAVRLDLGLEPGGRALEAVGVGHQACGSTGGATGLRAGQYAGAGGEER